MWPQLVCETARERGPQVGRRGTDLDHVGEEGLSEPHVGHDVDIHRLLALLIGELQEGLALHDAGVVHQYIHLEGA